jgi:hypothetical protein
MSPTIYQFIIRSNPSCSKVCADESVAKRTSVNKWKHQYPLQTSKSSERYNGIQ